MSRESFMNDAKKHAGHRRAPKQEKQIAKRSGGRPIRGSGSGYKKGDVEKAHGIFRVEAKTTKHQSFSVTRDMIRKIEAAALPHGEVPAMIIEFISETGTPEMEVAVVPTYVLEEIAKQ